MITMELRRVKRDKQIEWKMKGHLSLHALGSEAMSKFVKMRLSSTFGTAMLQTGWFLLG